MKNLSNQGTLLIGLGIGLLVCGCSQKRIESTEVPRQVQSDEASTLAKASGAPWSHYRVVKNDCLWSIAGKPGVYGDSFEWPALFKANRDQIKDPDLIYPRQDLQVETGLSIEQRNQARQLAMETPKYVSHSKPRASLPVDYF